MSAASKFFRLSRVDHNEISEWNKNRETDIRSSFILDAWNRLPSVTVRMHGMAVSQAAGSKACQQVVKHISR
jgi:hypothetical protein